MFLQNIHEFDYNLNDQGLFCNFRKLDFSAISIKFCNFISSQWIVSVGIHFKI